MRRAYHRAMDRPRHPFAPPPAAAPRIAPVHGAHADLACRLCGQPLSALQRRRGDVCDAMDCRRRAVDELRKAEREQSLADAVLRACDDWNEPALRAAPVVWLSDHDARLVAATADELAEQRDYLIGLEAAAAGPDPMRIDGEPPSADDSADPAIGHRLCAFCAGRCCRTGGQHNAFIRADLMRRWLLRHEGRAWADAVDDYLRRIPERHASGSCLNHGERGCTLPREMRSDICNEYACDPLVRVRTLATADPALQVVAAVVKEHGLRDAAVVSAAGIRAIG